MPWQTTQMAHERRKLVGVPASGTLERCRSEFVSLAMRARNVRSCHSMTPSVASSGTGRSMRAKSLSGEASPHLDDDDRQGQPAKDPVQEVTRRDDDCRVGVNGWMPPARRLCVTHGSEHDGDE